MVVSSLLEFCVFFLYLEFGLMNCFLLTGPRKDTTNLRKFHQRKRDKSCSKDPYFLCHET